MVFKGFAPNNYMYQYVPGVTLAQYFRMIQQVAGREGAEGADLIYIGVRNVNPPEAWEDITFDELDSLEDVLGTRKEFHMMVKLSFSKPDDVLRIVQTYHYWQMLHVADRKTWAEVVSEMQPPRFDKKGRLE